MKKRLKIMLGVVAVLVLGIAASFYFTSGIVNIADDFFKAVREGDIAKARAYLSEDFKASTDESALTEFLSKSSILNFKKSSWSNRQISGGRGELDGSFTTETGGVVPIRMFFVKEQDNWKIHAIQKPTAGLLSGDASQSVPTEADQIALVKQSIHDFIISLEKKSMEHFRTKVSQLWRKQHTTEDLNQAFKAIIDSAENLSMLDGVNPVLDADPKITEDGVLVLVGYYPTNPTQIHFKQQYIYEGLSWKLLGFSIEAK